MPNRFGRGSPCEVIVLSSLRIRDLAIIDDVEVPLSAGLLVLTGETGAGKSIIVGALDLLLGARASAEVVRTGAEQAVVEGLFVEAPEEVRAKLAELSLLDEDDPGTVLVRRLVGANGRSRAFINGALVNQSTLRELAQPLVDMTSQHAQYALLDPSTHIDVLDRFAGLWEQRQIFAAGWSAFQALLEERRSLQRAERERVDREDFLRFQLGELGAAKLEVGEEEAIASELGRLRNATRLRTGAQAAGDALVGDRGASGALVQAQRLVEGLAQFDPSLAALGERLTSARIEVDDIGEELLRYADDAEDDPARLEQLEERAALIRRVLRKYGPTVDDALARLRDVQAELARFTGAEARLLELEGEIGAAEAQLLHQARVLRQERESAAASLSCRVEAELKDLAMGAARFRVEFDTDEAAGPKLGPLGIDRLELEVATNSGEPFRPLAKSASGGELSRILLAIKSVLLESDPVPTSVFDEVDTGVGGAVAEIIGRKLALASAQRQVVCITHLAQIAAFADSHLQVRKEVAHGRTVTRVRALSAEERLAEVARMLGGVTITERTREHASEMIRTARRAP